jgi:hypothetical protein
MYRARPTRFGLILFALLALLSVPTLTHVKPAFGDSRPEIEARACKTLYGGYWNAFNWEIRHDYNGTADGILKVAAYCMTGPNGAIVAQATAQAVIPCTPADPSKYFQEDHQIVLDGTYLTCKLPSVATIVSDLTAGALLIAPIQEYNEVLVESAFTLQPATPPSTEALFAHPYLLVNLNHTISDIRTTEADLNLAFAPQALGTPRDDRPVLTKVLTTPITLRGILMFYSASRDQQPPTPGVCVSSERCLSFPTGTSSYTIGSPASPFYGSIDSFLIDPGAFIKG